MEVHEHVVATLLEETEDVTCFENCETVFPVTPDVSDKVAWKHQCSWKEAKIVLWRVEEKWKARGCRIWFGGEVDRPSSMLWPYTHWIFSDGRI